MSGNKAYSEPFLANCCFPSILEELLMQVNRQSSKELPLHWSPDSTTLKEQLPSIGLLPLRTTPF
ncbi:hypothetical protein [Bradyrhizobium sp. NC92]|uniref:hypothetical protein n=1 Tax=Bradyrhizobium sp. (strain NC92) TaxID=55395 RepID=UPI0021AA1989|nr:hypothetical protein [Bradyrhizobium sp. NC92]UWU72361.1 hypothetical protein N2602_18090 [Bradyrhizobium sp. NC92]